MSLTFSVEPLSHCWDEMVALAHEHWKETEGYRHNQPFCPKRERYDAYDKAGWYFEAVARDQGRMVGYAGMYVVPSMHTQQLIATEDAWFLLPDYRKGRNAIRFYQFVEEECRKRGCVEITMSAKLTNAAGRILEYLKFQCVERRFSKSLQPKESDHVCTEPSSGT